jgi:hypothetical protein
VKDGVVTLAGFVSSYWEKAEKATKRVYQPVAEVPAG